MVKLYYDPACPFCARVLRFAEQENIEFEPKLISLHMDSPTKQELVQLGGKPQVPFLIDEARGVQMYESADIMTYLKEHYAN